ncbi:MAG: hypothetical protein JWP60_1384 [Ramlibacter sp.]|nr:hypothetical protein [Ramlibacter sp.]
MSITLYHHPFSRAATLVWRLLAARSGRSSRSGPDFSPKHCWRISRMSER